MNYKKQRDGNFVSKIFTYWGNGDGSVPVAETMHMLLSMSMPTQMVIANPLVQKS